MKISTRLLVCLFAYTSMAVPAYASSEIYMEDMTWMEIRDRMQDGATTVIVPTGGTEQNGPHMVTGKHNIIVRYTAGQVAKRLGNTLVAPVMAYVPEGRIDPPEGHMQFPGTISLSNETFALVLQDTANSLKQHGFKLICFMGDSGGNQDTQKAVAKKLNEKWASSGVRVLHVSDYYGKNGQDKWVRSTGIDIEDPGAHAGFEDTSELMKLDAQAVRPELLAKRTEKDYKKTGAMGDSSKASAGHGRQLLQLKIDAAVNQISRYARDN